MKRQDYRTRVAKTLNFEEHIFSEFEQLCKEENTYPSHKLQELIIGELEKKVVGGQNPLNVSYGIQKEKPFQLTLDSFKTREKAIQSIKKLKREEIDQAFYSAKYCIIACRWRKTGVAAEDFSISW